MKSIPSNLHKIVGLFLILIGSGLIGFIIPLTITQEPKIKAYYQSLGLEYEYIKIPVEERLDYAGIMITPIKLKNASAGSVPILIHINGANNRKEQHMEYSTAMARLGFKVFSMETRGTGQTGGYFTLYGKEPGDISKIIDYINATYPEANITKIAVSGFSLGAGQMLLAQAIDDRIFCSVLYHPPTNISGLLAGFGISEILGNNLWVKAPYASTKDIAPLDDRSAYLCCNENNTKNLLLLQGSDDGIVNVEDTKDFYNRINPHNRSDIVLKVRPGLDHVPNENDDTSRRYAMTWFNHFYFNQTIDITNLESELLYQIILPYENPSNSKLRSNLFLIGVIFIEIGLLIGIVSQKWKKDKRSKLVELEGKPLQKLFWSQTAILIASISIIGIISRIIDPNILLGLLMAFPITSCIMLLLHRVWFERNEKQVLEREWKKEIIENIKLLFIFNIPIVLGVLILDWSANQTISTPIWPWKWTFLLYLGLFTLLLYWTNFCINYFSFKTQWKYGLLMIGVWLIVASIYSILNPVLEGNFIPYLPILFPFAIAIVCMLLAVLMKGFSIIYNKPFVAAFSIAFILTVILMERFMALLV